MRPDADAALRRRIDAQGVADRRLLDQHDSATLVRAGRICDELHDQHVRGVKARRIQCDEIWSFTYAKQKNVKAAKAAPEGADDTWTWTALEADTKLLVSWLVGGA